MVSTPGSSIAANMFFEHFQNIMFSQCGASPGDVCEPLPVTSGSGFVMVCDD